MVDETLWCLLTATMWKLQVRTIISPQKIILIIPLIILFCVYPKPFSVPKATKLTDLEIQRLLERESVLTLNKIPEPMKSAKPPVNLNIQRTQEPYSVLTFNKVPNSIKSTKPPVGLRIQIVQKRDILPKMKETKSVEKFPACPSVLDNMVFGSWVQRAMTQIQRSEIEHFYSILARYRAVPPNFQRQDLKCGNVTYPPPYNPWIRAVCDLNGRTPCCYNNRCVNMTTEECKCDNCYDIRTRIIAEYADWVPFDRRCAVKMFDQNDACKLLSDHVIVTVGDSMARHVYIALLLMLQNNYVDGALDANTPPGIRKECLNMEVLTDKLCRNYITRDIQVCGGKVRLIMKEYKNVRYLNATTKLLTDLSRSTKSLVLVGIGVHDDYNSTTLVNSYLNPLIKHYKTLNQSRTTMVWATPSNYGLLKANRLPQRTVDVLRFMKETGDFLSRANIPQFNTYNMTRGVRSQDGHHYGLGVNKWKVFVLLNYIEELKRSGRW